MNNEIELLVAKLSFFLQVCSYSCMYSKETIIKMLNAVNHWLRGYAYDKNFDFNDDEIKYMIDTIIYLINSGEIDDVDYLENAMMCLYEILEYNQKRSI